MYRIQFNSVDGAGGKPAGLGNNEIQYNVGGALAASEGFKFTPGAGDFGPTYTLTMGNEADVNGAVELLVFATLGLDIATNGPVTFDLGGSSGTNTFGINASNTEFYLPDTHTVAWSVLKRGISIGPPYNLNLNAKIAGATLALTEGGDGMQGVVNLVGGTVTIGNSLILATSRIFVTSQVDGGVPGFLRVSNIISGIGFTIQSSNPLDTSTVAYFITQVAE
jgi:hypothetical protein